MKRKLEGQINENEMEKACRKMRWKRHEEYIREKEMHTVV
jgi:hypothetical protein